MVSAVFTKLKEIATMTGSAVSSPLTSSLLGTRSQHIIFHRQSSASILNIVVAICIHVMNESLLGIHMRMMFLMLSRNYDKVDDFGDMHEWS